jgi:hypothetical protein
MIIVVPTGITFQTSFFLSANNSVPEVSDSKTFVFGGQIINLTKFDNISSIINNSLNLRVTEIDKEASDEEYADKEASEEQVGKSQNSSQLATISNSSFRNTSQIDSTNIEKIWNGLDIISAAELKEVKLPSQYLRLVNPPDVSLAVGKNNVAQIVHSSIGIWNKTGVLLQIKPLYDLFNVSSKHYITDPKILYDSTTDRWFATIVDGGIETDAKDRYTCEPSCKVIIAVSTGNDPTQLWHTKEINATNTGYLPDQPNFTVNKFNFTLTTIEFPVSPKINHSINIYRTYIIDKNSLVNQNTSVAKISGSNTNEARYPIPYFDSSECSSTASVIKENGTELFSNVSSIRIVDYCDPSDMDNKSNPIVKLNSSLSPAPLFRQPSSETNKDTNEKMEIKIHSATRNSSSVWLALHSACTPVVLSKESCLNILRFDRINAPSTVHGYSYTLSENSQYRIKGTDVYYPAIGMSKNGNLFFISGFSNSTTYPSLVASELVSVNNTKDRNLVNGSDSNISPSFGDYFASAVDPIDGSVWLSGEYVDKNIPIPKNFPEEEKNNLNGKSWSTIIAKVS